MEEKSWNKVGEANLINYFWYSTKGYDDYGNEKANNVTISDYT